MRTAPRAPGSTRAGSTPGRAGPHGANRNPARSRTARRHSARIRTTRLRAVRLCSAGLRLAILLAFAAALLGCRGESNWITFRGDRGRGATERAIRPPLGVRWKLHLQADGDRLESFNPPVIKDDIIYFGSRDGNFYALDIESGYMRWVFRTDAPINAVPYADQDRVYFGSLDGRAYALNREDGSKAWSFNTGRPVQSSVTRYEDRVLFASDGGATFAVSLDGEERLRLPNPIWYYITFQVHDDVMYFAPGPPHDPRSLAAYDLAAEEYLWTLDTMRMNAVWYSFPAIDGERLFMATGAPSGGFWEMGYYALDRDDGSILWQSRKQSRWPPGFAENPTTRFRDNVELLDYMAPAVWRDRIIFTSGDSVVRAFDPDDGSLRWERSFDAVTTSAPTVAGDRVYFGLDAVRSGERERPPRLLALSARDGSRVWEMELEGSVLSAPVIAGRFMVFGTDESVFYILEELI